MKIDRMIGILSLLLQKEKVTAPWLAEHFEVSKRTIVRDIEDLCKAGIPICTSKGSGGGISIMEGYRLDRTLLTSREMQMILNGLRSLDSVDGSNSYKLLMDKLKAGSSDFIKGNASILIDLSSWNRKGTEERIQILQASIEQKKVISFYYYSPSGESIRSIEPYYLIYKWSNWYVWGFCYKSKAFRMFKLNRMDRLISLQETFTNRTVPMPGFDTKDFFPATVHLKAIVDPSMKWHLIESFGPSSFSSMDDGFLLLETDMDEEGILSWLLSMRELVTVLEPEEVRKRLFAITSAIAEKYKS